MKRLYNSHRTDKPVGVTLCQFDSDLRHHVFRHEKYPQAEIWGASYLVKLPNVDQTSTKGFKMHRLTSF